MNSASEPRWKSVESNSDEFIASSSFSNLVRIWTRCPLGGRMYDLWESLLLESELESQVTRHFLNVSFVVMHFSLFCQVLEENGVSDGKRDLYTIGELCDEQDTSIIRQQRPSSRSGWTLEDESWDSSRSTSKAEKESVSLISLSCAIFSPWIEKLSLIRFHSN